tara:strand:- start:2700 stop:3395 length:696 start_codon:yes stop_codon:yes gene_type:complete
MSQIYKQYQDKWMYTACDIMPKELIDGMYNAYMEQYNKGRGILGKSPPMLGKAIEFRGKHMDETTAFKKAEAFLTNWLQENMGMRTVPTYNMGRIYTEETTGMFAHQDRVPCEVSVTLPIAYDNTPWAINVEDSSGTINNCLLHVGDVLFYYGCKARHHRGNNSLNKFHIQHYFHYADLDSELGSFYNYWRQDGDLWPETLDKMISRGSLPLMSEEDKIRYSKQIGEEYNV